MMVERFDQLMRRQKNETQNPDPYNEDEVTGDFILVPKETVTFAHTGYPTATSRGPVYYASDGSIGDDVTADPTGDHIFAGFFKAS